jgi:hypothetical protein
VSGADLFLPLVLILAFVIMLINSRFREWLVARWRINFADRRRYRPMTREEGRAVQCMLLINKLREQEGWAVEIVGDNPDFGLGPNCVVSVFGDWEDSWTSKRFQGDDLLSTLRNAHASYALNLEWKMGARTGEPRHG